MAILLLLIFSFLLAYFFGKKRQIGLGWSLFFCFFLNPIIGFIIILLSRKYADPNPEPSKPKTIAGWALIAIASIVVLGGVNGLIVGFPENNNIPVSMWIGWMFFYIGLIGLGYYMVQLGKGKNFNDHGMVVKNH